MRKFFLPLFFLAASVAAQPGHGPISGGGSGGGAATAVTGSATLPATCTEKDLYQDTDSGGTEFYVCTSANVWTKTIAATDNVATATALAADPANCTAGNYPLGVSASGAAQSCTAAATGTIGGSTGSINKAILSANGTGGSTVQSSLATIDGALITLNYAGGIFNSLSGFVAGMWIGGPSGSLGADGYLSWSTGGDGGIMGLEKNAASDYRLGLRDTARICWTSTGAAENVENCDVGFGRIAAGIVGATNGTPSGMGWVTQDGQRALSADFTSTSVTPANLTGLTVTLKTGRKYTFRMALRFSDSTAADGARFDFDGGAGTATDFGAICRVYDSTPALLHVLDVTALATDLVATTTTGASFIECDGSFTVNAAGTFIPRAGQEAASGGTLTVETGSYLNVTDASFN